MGTEREVRRLAAVLHADVVGYSRLMEQDESGTHESLRTIHANVMEPCISRHNGRIVHVRGDGTLMEFQSAVDAVRFAIEFQSLMESLNSTEDSWTRIDHRIGINVGDVIVDRGEIFGNGVNVAVRMEGLAPTGGICISGTVADQVQTQMDIGLTAIGAQKIKNIAIPVDAFWIEQNKRAGLHALKMRIGARRGIAAAIGFAIVAMFGGFGIAHYAQSPETPPTGGTVAVSDLPSPVADRPSLAVLPFSNMGPDPEQEYFVDGISEDLITDLSGISGLFVIARNSTFAYKGKAVDIRRVGRDLGVRYVLEGSIRKIHGSLRVNAQLIEAKTGTHVWAERFDRKISDLFKLQDEITAKIVTALQITLTAQERTKTGTAPTDIYEAYDAYLRGLADYHRNSFENITEAIGQFKRAAILDPQFSLAHAALAAAYLNARRNGWSTTGRERTVETQTANPSALRKMQLAEARKHLAEAMKSPTPWAYRVATEIATLDGMYDLALEHIEAAIALAPNDPENYAQRGLLYTWVSPKNICGNSLNCENAHEKNALAISNIKRAMRLDPKNSRRYLSLLGAAEYAAGNYVEASTYLEQGATYNPDNVWLQIHLIATYGQLGRTDDAHEALVRLRAMTERQDRTDYTILEVRTHAPYRFSADTQHLVNGLFLARMKSGDKTFDQ